MPKIVDHEQRREELAEALWRVILRDGVDRVSVRTVASESGHSAGSLRHYFTTQDELLVFAMRLVIARATARILALPVEGEPVELVVIRCLEVLPLDDQRKAEAEVWLALTMAGRASSELRMVREEADASMRELCDGVVTWLTSVEAFATDRDPAREAVRLRALLDGLTMEILLEGTDPGAEPIIRMHLADLATPPPTPSTSHGRPHPATPPFRRS